jgi:glycosyltransferase involved in cell wall biosynthesis
MHISTQYSVNQILVSRDLGGAGLFALRIADELRKRSQPSRVWIPGEGAAAHEAHRLELEVEYYDPALISGTQPRWQAAIGNLGFWKDIRGGGRGLVHVHSPYAYRLLLPGLLLSRMPRVAHVQLDEGHEGLRWAFCRPPHLIITCARYLVDSVRQALPRSLQESQWIEAVPNAVDTRRFRPGDKQDAKQRVGAPTDSPLALMLANLAPHKGQETAIRAVAILKQVGIPVHCWLAGVERGGCTAYTDRLDTLIAELGVGDLVRLLGQRDDPDLLLRAADFFLLPSTHEGLPLSILEAQATKVPVLASPTAGIPEVVSDGETGFLIAADDASGYAHWIRYLIENPSFYQRVADKAHLRATSELSWESYRERIMALYQSLLQQRWDRRQPPLSTSAKESSPLPIQVGRSKITPWFLGIPSHSFREPKSTKQRTSL